MLFACTDNFVGLPKHSRFTTKPVICRSLMIHDREMVARITSKPLLFDDLNIPAGWRACLRRSSIWVESRSNFCGAKKQKKNHSDFSRRANYHAEIWGESSSKANYHLKNRADQNNRCHENAGKVRWNIVSSEISLKSHKKPGISSKFVCIAFAQYCIWVNSKHSGKRTLCVSPPHWKFAMIRLF